MTFEQCSALSSKTVTLVLGMTILGFVGKQRDHLFSHRARSAVRGAPPSLNRLAARRKKNKKKTGSLSSLTHLPHGAVELAVRSLGLIPYLAGLAVHDTPEKELRKRGVSFLTTESKRG